MGTVYEDLSDYEKAKDYYEQLLVVRREIKDRSSEGRTLHYLGIVYYYLSNYEKAAEHYKQALVIYRETKDLSSESLVLYNLGSVYEYLSNYETRQKINFDGFSVNHFGNNVFDYFANVSR